ncbi:major facilitator superfamily domain-containing protein [Chytridium lagenaria]|nr:major facilitator superfamily domain-containing protein [Chytridium lagenaria]
MVENPALTRIKAAESDLDASGWSGSVSSSISRQSSIDGLDDLGSSSVASLSTLRRRKHRPRSLLRRGSSFGGAPIVVQNHSLPAEVVTRQTSSSAVAYDNPAALNKPLQEYLGHDYDLWQYELNLLYAVYSFPNMFLPFIGGQLVDRLDTRFVLLGFSICVCVGQTLFSIGVSYKSFGTMLVGRVLFGIGGESISVVQSSITTSWFKKKELAFALGLNLCISRFGSVVNAICSPRIDKLWGTAIAVWVGTLTCYLSFFCAVILASIIATRSPPTDGQPHQRTHSQPPQIPTAPNLSESSPLSRSETTIDQPPRAAHYISFDRSLDQHPPSLSSSSLSPIHTPRAVETTVDENSALLGIIPFNTIASDFLMSKWYPGDTETPVCIPDSMSAILVPICGAFVDRYGHRATLLILCAIVIAAVHLTLVAIWPSIATIIQHREQVLWDAMPENSPMPRLLGSAYGLSTAALNTALTVIPLVTAQIRVGGGSFVPVEMFFVGVAVMGLGCCLALWWIDRQNGSILELPEAIYESVEEHREAEVEETLSRGGEEEEIVSRKALAKKGTGRMSILPVQVGRVLSQDDFTSSPLQQSLPDFGTP